MRIAIDYDGTYTADPDLWDGFIKAARAAGHKIWIVTCRRGDDEERQDIKVPGAFIVFTAMMAKKAYCEQRLLNIDIWIDDDPASIIYGK